MLLSRKKQDEDFLKIGWYADSDCKCNGTGKGEWTEYSGDVKVSRHELCPCVMKNIQKIKDAEDVPN